MSWAEFVLRSIGFKRVRDYEFNLKKMQAYETHNLRYLLSKKKPPTFDRFWMPKEKQGLTDDQKLAMEIALKKYKEDIDG